MQSDDHEPTTAIERPSWLGPDVWPFEIRTWRHRGRNLHYLDEGPAPDDQAGDPPPTLVLVHAGMWSYLWRDLVTELRGRYRCLAIDFPGAGLSDGRPSDVDLGAFADLLGHWLDDLGVERATFVLHDLGGVVGVTAAAARPGRVDGLAAINTFAWWPETRGLRAMLGFMGGSAATATLGNLGVIPRLTATGAGVGRHLDRAARRAFRGPYAARPDRSRAFHRAMRSAVRSPDLYAAADRALATDLAHLPLLTVFGEKNDPFGFADRWRERFPAATSHVVAGGNHFPMCDAPREVASWIERWHRAEVAGSRADGPTTRSRAPGRSGPVPASG
jgi:haloalkane dehalogenase